MVSANTFFSLIFINAKGSDNDIENSGDKDNCNNYVVNSCCPVRVIGIINVEAEQHEVVTI